MRIGIKYCGGCNPYIDRSLLTRRLAEELRDHDCSLEFFQISGCDVVIVINGCAVGCAKVPQGKIIAKICGAELNMRSVSEEDLPRETARRVLERLRKC